jgi:hypothetical protein
VSVLQLRQDTRRYAADLQVQAMKFWQAWLDTALMPNHVETGQSASTSGLSL